MLNLDEGKVTEDGVARLGHDLIGELEFNSPEYFKKVSTALEEAYRRLSFMYRVTARPGDARAINVEARMVRIMVPDAELESARKENTSIELFTGLLSGMFTMFDREFLKGLSWREKSGDTNVGRVTASLGLNAMMKVREVFRYKNRSCATNLASSTAWSECICNDEVRDCVDMKTRYADLINGEIATLLGATVYSDAFHHPKLRIFEDRTIWFLESPERVGFFDFSISDFGIADSGVTGVTAFELHVLLRKDLVANSVASLLVLN